MLYALVGVSFLKKWKIIVMFPLPSLSTWSEWIIITSHNSEEPCPNYVRVAYIECYIYLLYSILLFFLQVWCAISWSVIHLINCSQVAKTLWFLIGKCCTHMRSNIEETADWVREYRIGQSNCKLLFAKT